MTEFTNSNEAAARAARVQAALKAKKAPRKPRAVTPPLKEAPGGQLDMFPRRAESKDYRQQTPSALAVEHHDLAGRRAALQAPQTHKTPTWSGPTRVTHGVVDEDAEHVFTRGQCHAFALALHHTHGWKLGTVMDNGDGIPTHYYAQHPTGAIADIHGLHDPDDFARKWGAGGSTPHQYRGNRHPTAENGGPSVVEGEMMWKDTGARQPATVANANTSARRQMTRHLTVHTTHPDPAYDDDLELDHDTDDDDIKEMAARHSRQGVYKKPNMAAAQSMVNPWTQHRATHWQPTLDLEWDGHR